MSLSHPIEAAINAESMQELNGVLSSIKSATESFPLAMRKQVPFYIRREDGSLSYSELVFRTSGGDCRRQITASFANFFKEIGIIQVDKGTSFAWNKEYFPDKIITNEHEHH